MKKLLLFIGIIACGTAFADKTTTSKAYVTNQLATKQDKVPAVDTNTVITTTDTTGEIGEKAIYDASGNYAEQVDALVTAADANAAVQNAIDTEFVCIEWAPNTTETPENCYIWKIQNQTEYHSSKNLFNLQKSRVLYSSNSENQAVKHADGWTVKYPGVANGYYFVMIEVGDIQDFLGKTLTISAKVNCINGAHSSYDLGRCNDNCTSRVGSRKTIAIPESLDGITSTKIAFWLYATAGGGTLTAPECTYYDIQIEEGSVATEYEPYKNLYIPQNQ